MAMDTATASRGSECPSVRASGLEKIDLTSVASTPRSAPTGVRASGNGFDRGSTRFSQQSHQSINRSGKNSVRASATGSDDNLNRFQRVSSLRKRESDATRRGVLRRASGQRFNEHTVEGKRASGLNAKGRLRINSSFLSSGGPAGSFREHVRGELDAVGERMVSEHDRIVSLLLQRSDFFEKELELIMEELQRMCDVHDLPPPEYKAVPHRLSVAQIMRRRESTLTNQQPKRRNSLQIVSYADLLKGGRSSQNSSMPSISDVRSSFTSECEDEDDSKDMSPIMSKTTSIESNSMVSAFSDGSQAVGDDVMNQVTAPCEPEPTDLIVKPPAPPSQMYVPPRPLSPLPNHICPGVSEEEHTVKVALNQDKDDAAPLPDTKPAVSPNSLTVGKGGGKAPLAPVTPPTQMKISITPASGGGGGLAVPEATVSQRVSWHASHADEIDEADFGGFDDGSSDGWLDGAFELARPWQDKSARRSGRTSSRRQSETKRVSESAMAATFTQTNHDIDDDSDVDQRILHRHMSTRTLKSSLPCGTRLRLGLRRLVVHPESRLRILCDTIGAILVAYESVAIPLQFFVLNSMFLSVMEWLIRLFWSYDLFLSAFTSFNRGNGKLERRPQRVFCHYVKGWFFFDLLMVLLDWAELVLLDDGGLKLFGRIAKGIRIFRTLRMLRLIKSHNFPELVKVVAYYFRSDMAVIIMSLVRLVIFLIWMNHVCACCWYGIAVNSGSNNWISHWDLEDTSKWNLYLSSFHWSLSQFAAGSVEALPRCLGERVYAVAALLFAYVVSAWIVSSITSSLTRLEIAAAQDSQKMTILKQYLFDNNISRQLALRMQRHAQHAFAEKTKQRDESTIELLSMISEPLKMDMHFEINSKWLSFHPLLRNHIVESPGLMRQVCHHALTRVDLTKGDMLFTDDEPCLQPTMYFVQSGKLSFLHGLASTSKGVGVGHWACEATLWTDWIHCGDMRVFSETSTMILLDAVAFQSVVLRSEHQWMHFFDYARKFVNHLNESSDEKLTDLCDPDMDLESWAAEACPDYQVQQSQGFGGFRNLKRSAKVNDLGDLLMEALGNRESSVFPHSS